MRILVAMVLITAGCCYWETFTPPGHVGARWDTVVVRDSTTGEVVKTLDRICRVEVDLDQNLKSVYRFYRRETVQEGRGDLYSEIRVFSATYGTVEWEWTRAGTEER